ncbi:MAG: GTP cyclohydrolase I FolE2 [Armatimonadota bacterium]|nr:MAG: GTP cyclohydrolase I FolE2 [Armatimonadota bacterium]
MKDVAASADTRGITVERVGVKDVHLPIRVMRKAGGFDSVLARIDLGVELSHQFRGTHMSRFVDILFEWSRKPISKPEIRQMLEEACHRLEADSARVEVAFKYFITKSAPSSKSESSLDYDCRFEGVLDDGSYELTMGVEVPVTILCPCSKEISRCGAHNQRAIISVRIRCEPDSMVWIEDLVSMLERQGSAEVFPLLKREDEKFVTEAAYENPKFVEDVVRDVVSMLRDDQKVGWFQVSCESLESIHNHTVYAFHEESRETPPAGGGSRQAGPEIRS